MTKKMLKFKGELGGGAYIIDIIVIKRMYMYNFLPKYFHFKVMGKHIIFTVVDIEWKVGIKCLKT